jgi:hypothetical protein
MSEKEKLPKPVAIAIWLVFVAIVATVYVVKIKDREQLVSNPEYTEGVIIKISEVAKGEQYVDYNYVVDGMLYEGDVSVSFCKACKSKCCKVGAKVRVRYDRNNPENSDLVHQ